MAYEIEFETTVAGGFPVLIQCTVEKADPDVGIMGPYADDFGVTLLNGKPATFIESKITEDDWNRIRGESEEHCYD